MKTKIIRNCCGTTLLELIIGMFITSIIVVGLYRVVNSVFTISTREKEKSEMISSITTVSNIIEKDIRTAGFGLPGNGMRTIFNDGLNDYLLIFTNEKRVQTSLTNNAQWYEYTIYVADASNFRPDEWLCIEGVGLDTIYREIRSITNNASGPDAIEMVIPVAVAGMFTAGSRVYAATRISYNIIYEPQMVLRRIKNDIAMDIGTKLEKISVVPKNISGTVVGSARNADVLTVVLGGYIGTGGNRCLYADSTEVNIRN